MENKGLKKRRLGRFAIVGIFNTGFDFAILNSLVFMFGVPDIVANIISASVAASVSFFLNRRFVFMSRNQRTARQFIVFMTITLVGLYGLQNLIIYTFTNHLTAPSGWAFSVLNWLSPGTFSRDFVSLNFAKAVATFASLTWNYILYARLVFRPSSNSSSPPQPRP